MTHFDYAAWVERAQRFVGGVARLPHARVHSTVVAPPVSEASLAALEQELRRTLPVSLREFFLLGAGSLDCGYVFEPDGQTLAELREILPDQTRIFGGARLGPASELPDFAEAVAEWADQTWVAETPDQRAIWKAALPFARMDNGDYLALAVRAGESDGPVVYLNHDDESSVIAANLVAFLNAWERLAYLGPEHWLLLEFLDGRGQLDPDTDRAARLRGLFAP